MTHIDDWLDDPSNAKEYPLAHVFFEMFRRPAFDKWKQPFEGKLFCTWQGKRMRVTGCSRLGDVWLHSKLDWQEGEQPYYQHRVDVAECSEWGDAP